jgi:tubulin polyglutamylase TTLL6/13
MHLTNYAINKSDPRFIANKNINEDDIGHKRSISSVYRRL